MTPEEFEQYISSLTEDCKNYILYTAPRDAAGIARTHFLKNFDNEGFEGDKWKEVQRRTAGTRAFAHYSKKDSTRARDKILHDTGALRRSLEDADNTKYYPGEAHIVSDLPYSAVHNEGLPAGKSGFLMPKRQFMGDSPVLEKEIQDKINSKMDKIINKNKK